MKITKVVYYKGEFKSLINCSIVFDDCLKISDIRLYRRDDHYYLVFPSKQDVYTEVRELNGGDVLVPKSHFKESTSHTKTYEEFVYPVETAFYAYLLETVVSGYLLKKTNGNVYRPTQDI